MTESEAIEVLKEKYRTMSMCLDIEDCKRNNQAISKAISSLEEIQQYRALGTIDQIEERMLLTAADATILREYEELGVVEELREAMEKQRAKKILKRKCDECQSDCAGCDDYVNRCPNCKEAVDNDFMIEYAYCPNCGQKLDWSEGSNHEN